MPSSNKLKNWAIALAAGAFLLSACLDTPKSTDPNTEKPATTANVSANMESLVGEFVSVRNDIQELVGETNFTLDEDRVFGGKTILVLNHSNAPLPLFNGDSPEVQVSGEVIQFVLADINREYGLDLDPNLYGKYEDQPAIIAQSVVLAPDPGDVTQNPEAFYNRTIAIEGEVDDIIATGVFELDEEQLFGGEDLLVIMIEPEAVQEDETVVATGVLRPFVMAEFEEEYNLDWELSVQEKIEAEYSNQPVLVAQKVYSLTK